MIPLALILALFPVDLAWDAPTTNVDGTPLTDLGGYVVSWGTKPNTYTSEKLVGNVTEAKIEFPTGKFYVAVRAVDQAGNRSPYSNEIVVTADAPTPTPTPEPSPTPSLTPSPTPVPSATLPVIGTTPTPFLELNACNINYRLQVKEYQAQTKISADAIRKSMTLQQKLNECLAQ